MIIHVYDGKINGKDNVIQFEKSECIYHCVLKDNNLFIKNVAFDTLNIKAIVFDFNEINFTYDLGWNPTLKVYYKTVNDMVDAFCNVARFIRRQYPKVQVYNDPNIWFRFGSKIEIYDAISNFENRIFKPLKYKKIEKESDLYNVDFFPVIIKLHNGSHTNTDKICHNPNELIVNYRKSFNRLQNVMCVEYKNTFVKELHMHLSIRIMVINNKILDFYARPSRDWNIHTNNQSRNDVLKADSYFTRIFSEHNSDIQRYINDFYYIAGNGFYAFDIILSDNYMHLCEVGLKIYDNTYARFINDSNMSIMKETLHPDYIRNVFRDVMTT